MKNTEVQIGATYVAMVTHRPAYVRVVAVNPAAGWFAHNETTGRDICIRSADGLSPLPKFRCYIDEPGGRSREISCWKAAQLVLDTYGTWRDTLDQARRPEGITLPGDQVVRACAA